MTCKDCIHYERCKWVVEWLRADCKIVLFDDSRQIEKECKCFKNRADVVKVVRCKNCKRAKPLVFENFYFCRKYRVCREADDFCSNGERKPKQ